MTSLAALLGQYGAALNERDAQRLACCYSDRFMHMSRHADGWAHGWRKNDADLGEHFRRAFAYYDALGAASFELSSVSESRPQPAHVLGRVAWRVAKSDGSELVTLDASYLIRIRQAEAKIVAFIDHDEQERLTERRVPVQGDSLLFKLPCRDAELRQRASQSGKVAIHELFEALERSRASG